MFSHAFKHRLRVFEMSNKLLCLQSCSREKAFEYLGVKQALLIFWLVLYVWPHVLLSTKSVCFYNQNCFARSFPLFALSRATEMQLPHPMLYFESKTCVHLFNLLPAFLHPCCCCDSIVLIALLFLFGRPLLSRRS